MHSAPKLSRTHATLLEALNRHRGKGQQKVTVEHVHAHNGGQAIVGNVEGAILMADRQDLLLAQKVEDLRRKVFELAALIGGPDG